MMFSQTVFRCAVFLAVIWMTTATNLKANLDSVMKNEEEHITQQQDSSEEAMCNHLNNAAFIGVQQPGICNMSSLGLRQVPPNIPANTTILDLSHNKISQILNSSFPKIHSFLRQLIISHNFISSLDVGAFRNLSNLEVLDLSYNSFSSPRFFPDDVFLPSHHLHTLYLHGNIPTDGPADGMTMFPDNALSKLTSLTTLVLDGPGNLLLGKGFQKMVSLRKLSFGYGGKCCITHNLFNDTFRYVTKELTNLSMSHCDLRYVSNVSLAHFTKLQFLDISHNYQLNISNALRLLEPLTHQPFLYIGFGSVNSEVKPLSSYTTLNKCNAKHFLDMCINDLDLSNNSIVSIDYKLITKHMLQCLSKLDLHNNVFNDTVTTHNLLKYLASSPSLDTIDMSHQRQSLADYNNKLRRKTFNNYDMSERTNRIEIKVPPSLRSANFSGFLTSDDLEWSGKYRFTGAEKLTYLDFSNNSISCTTEVTGLEAVRSLRISGSDCSKINLSIFKAFPNLLHLWIDQSQLGWGFQKYKNPLLLAPLESLQFISMSNNKLGSLPHNFFYINLNITTIKIAGNSLTDIQLDWLDLPLIEEIDVSYNNIATLRASVMDKLDVLAKKRPVKIHLKGNILSCSCEHLQFIKWIGTTKVALDKEQGYQCRLPNNSLINTLDVDKAMNELELQCSSRVILIGIVAVCAPSILVLILVTVIYRHRWTLQFIFWKFKMQWGVNVTLIESSEGIANDLFVMYSHHDTEWVVQVLVDKLEKQLGFKLAFYGRDFLPGEYIRTEVVSKICSSRCSLFVVTKNYLQSDYSKFETQMVALRSLEKLSHKIFVILKDDIPIRRLPFFFQNMWNRVVCLPWTHDETGQRELWKKLEKALRQNQNPVLRDTTEEENTSESRGEDNAASVMDFNNLTSRTWYEEVMRQGADIMNGRESNEISADFDDADRQLLL